MGDKADIEALLKENNSVQFYPQGWSMYPLIIPGRDMVVVEPVSGEDVTGLKKNDVILYRNQDDYKGIIPADGKDGILILHRITRIEGDSFYERGDNMLLEVGPHPLSSIIGRLTAVVRKGRMIKTKGLLYGAYVFIWPLLTPLRKIKRAIFDRERKN